MICTFSCFEMFRGTKLKKVTSENKIVLWNVESLHILLLNAMQRDWRLHVIYCQMSKRTQKLPLYARINKVQYDKYNKGQDEKPVVYTVRWRRVSREWSSAEGIAAAVQNMLAGGRS